MIIAFGVQVCLLFEILTGEANGYFFKKIIINIVAALGLGNQPAIGIGLAMGATENLEAIKKLPTGLPFMQAWTTGLLFVQQTHNAGLLWPGNASLLPCVENSCRGSQPHRPNP